MQSETRADITIKVRPPNNAVLLLFCAFTVPLPLWTILVGGTRALLFTLPMAAIGVPGLLYAIHLATRRLRILDGQILLQSRIATQRLVASECDLIRSDLRQGGRGYPRWCIHFRLFSATRSLGFDVDEEWEQQCVEVLSHACAHAGVFDSTKGVMRRWPKSAVVERIRTRAASRHRWKAIGLALALAAMIGVFLAASRWNALYAAAAIMAPVVVWSGLDLLRERALVRLLPDRSAAGNK